MPDVTTFAVALQLGAAGAYEDVSAYLESEDEFTRSWGLLDPFDDVAPGDFAFTLANGDGRFTPGNPLSPYFATLAEGVGVSWQTNSRIVYGTVVGVEPVFPSDGDAPVAAWGQVRVTVSDGLGKAARDKDDLSLWSRYLNENALYHWEFGGPDGTTEVFDGCGSGIAFRLMGDAAAAQWGQTPPNDNYFTNGVRMNADPDVQAYWEVDLSTADLAYGWMIGFIMSGFGTTTALPRYMEVEDTFGGVIQYKLGSTGVPSKLVANGVTTDQLSTVTALRMYFAGGNFNVGLSPLYSYAASSVTHRPNKIRLLMDGTVASLYRVYISTAGFGNVPSVPTQIFGSTAATIEDRLDAIAALSGQTVDTEAGFSTYQVGTQSGADNSTLTNLTETMRVEGGRIFARGGGTLTAPTTEIVARPKVLARPETVAYTFDRATDLVGAPEFIRDLANRVSQVTADSGTTRVVATNAALVNQIGVVSDTITAPAYDSGILKNIGEDRIRRGNITDLRVQTLTVDARTTATDRWADLLALEPGDRIRVTGLPAAQLGYSSWDGWFIGGEESHTTTSNRFTLYLEPCLPAFVYDTAVYGAGGTLTLDAGVNSSATSLSVATTSAKFTTTNLPQNIIVDREIMTVTAADSGTPQTLTVTRAQSGTLAFAHASGAEVEIAPTSVYSY